MDETEKKKLRLELRKETLALLTAAIDTGHAPPEISGLICSRRADQLVLVTTCNGYQEALKLVLTTGED